MQISSNEARHQAIHQPPVVPQCARGEEGGDDAVTGREGGDGGAVGDADGGVGAGGQQERERGEECSNLSGAGRELRGRCMRGFK